MTLYCIYTENMKKWLVDAGHRYVQPNIECSEHVDVLSETQRKLDLVFPMFHALDQAMQKLHLNYHLSLQHALHASRLKLKEQLLWNVLQH